MFHRRYGSGGIDDVADEKTWRPGFVIVDDGALCCIVGPYEEIKEQLHLNNTALVSTIDQRFSVFQTVML